MLPTLSLHKLGLQGLSSLSVFGHRSSSVVALPAAMATSPLFGSHHMLVAHQGPASAVHFLKQSSLLTLQCRRGGRVEGGVVVKAVSNIQNYVSEGSSLGEVTKGDFPILDQYVNGYKLVYLDNAATSQKPASVLNALRDYYEGYNSNVHRGVHALSAKATDEYEAARKKIAGFINAPSDREIVFTRNASEAINLVAYTWGLTNLKEGDEVVLTVAEHHSNIVPWQLVAQKTGAILRFVELTSEEILDLEQLNGFLNERTKLVSIFHVSNVLGCINPVEDIVKWAHAVGAKVLVDACQSVPHMPVDVQALGDFLVASSHKMCGPTGMGFLWGKTEVLESMPPFLGGGEMIVDVFCDRSTYAGPPSRFEAGTPAIGEAVGFGAAVDYLNKIGMDRIHEYEMELSKYLYESLSKVPGVRIYGPPPGDHGERRASLCSFTVEGIHATDLSTFLDQQHGIAVRSGHHCTQPLHRFLGISASARASLYFYNTTDEVDSFIQGLNDTIDFFSSLK
ncbi:cysteine desulfurase 1, chloroplastic isoform X2 [Physcomitrium patens]|uniref:cysteine desulfurase n=1 Tax=Physcomitrium patens TaxID=3218 RepID=A0A2K1IG87_PHYPA|nr:cysteine desulfurase 1, chloroplastic-like isoform X2 [Physcomitrium patens]PNR28291.1 hypothetical protein PHYPA_028883 [Physcomitrium patens]|eukprot:XP_024363672.1 cysteine desulfurase 1, chloroplastic-like isoform X2 [Physcomitrella patens]